MSFSSGLPQSCDDLFPPGLFVLNTHVQGERRVGEMALEPTWDLFLDSSPFIRNEFVLIYWLFCLHSRSADLVGGRFSLTGYFGSLA